MTRPASVAMLLALLSACAHSTEPTATSGGAESSSEPAYLFVQNAQSVTASADTITLKGVSSTTVYFTDRPVRTAGHTPTVDFVSIWGEGEDSFNADPPNATLSIFGSDGKVNNVVVTISKPRFDGQDLTYDVRTLEGELPKSGGAAVLFIDVLVVRSPVLRVSRGVVIR